MPRQPAESLPALGVNIDHIATLRQARYRGWKSGLPPEPSILTAALEAEQAGAQGITVHLREDRRHIQDDDVTLLRRKIATRLNLEMAVTPAMVEKALEYRPDEVCLVPEGRQEVTTEGGLEVAAPAARKRVAKVIEALRAKGIAVSTFINTDLDQIRASSDVGATMVELHTGHFANATTKRELLAELRRHTAAFTLASSMRLQVNAGHGLHYTNLLTYLDAIPGVHTLNIGHAIVARAVFVGWRTAVAEMVALMRPAPSERSAKKSRRP